MPITREELERRRKFAEAQGWDADRMAKAEAETIRQAGGLAEKPQFDGKAIAKGFLPTAGAVIGGVIGSAVPVAGTAAGAVIGGALGEGLRQKVSGERFSPGKVALEGGLSVIGAGVGKGVTSGARAITKATGKGLVQQGENLALKSLRPSPSQMAKFAENTGQDLAKVVTKHDLVGKDADEIFDYVMQRQAQFDSIAKNAGVPIAPSAIRNTAMKKLQPLLQSVNPEDEKIADQVARIIQKIDKQSAKKPITLADLTTYRKQFDRTVKNWAADPVSAGYSRVVRDILQDTARNAADAAGLKAGGKTLRELGQELNVLNRVHDIAAIQQNLGRGTLPVGLLQLLGATAGGTAGGPLGAAAGVAAQGILNNRGTVAAGSKAALSAGRSILEGAETMGTKPLTKQLIGQNLVRPSTFGATPGDMPQAGPNENPTYLTADATLGGQEEKPLISQEDFFNMAMIDFQETGGKNLAKIQALQKLSGAGGGGKPLSAVQQGQKSKAESALRSIDRIATQVSEKPGDVYQAKLNPFSQGGRQLNADIRSAIDILGYLRTGATLTDEQAATYRVMFPQPFDSPETAQVKLRRLREEIASYLNMTPEIVGSQVPASPQEVAF